MRCPLEVERARGASEVLIRGGQAAGRRAQRAVDGDELLLEGAV